MLEDSSVNSAIISAPAIRKQSTVKQYGLPKEHAANHTVVFLRWLIEQDLLEPSFAVEAQSILEEFRAQKVGIHEVYAWCDYSLIDDMLSEEGNTFAMS